MADNSSSKLPAWWQRSATTQSTQSAGGRCTAPQSSGAPSDWYIHYTSTQLPEWWPRRGVTQSTQPPGGQCTPAQPAGSPPPHRYGGYALQRGDRDAQRRWAGQVRSTASAASHVRQLQRDLRELGFLVCGQPDGMLGLHTEWAIREFQIYSRMAHLAQESTSSTSTDYVARLSRVANTMQYAGPISGVVNTQTAMRIQHWLTHRWRCPVVIRAMHVSNNQPTTVAQDNLWLHDDVTSNAYRIYVRDFTRYYPLPNGQNEDSLRVLGSYTVYGNYGGPMSVPPRHCWGTAELLPSNLVGVADFQAMTPAQQSTFKVLRAVGEQECLGFFDSLNAYDNAIVSLGPCHWTLAILSGGVSEGELCGFLSFLRSTHPQAYQRAMEFFGLRIDEDWDAGGGNGATLRSNALKKYTGWPAQQGDTGSWTRMEETEAAANYYKTYHWYYRFQMAGRTIEGFQQAMWDMVRIRIRDIRNNPWGPGVANVGTGSSARPATIGDVITSERAMAIVLRWHVFRPAHVTALTQAGQRLRNAYDIARQSHPTLNWTQSPAQWGDAHEQALADAILGQAALVNTTVNNTANWPDWFGPGAQNPRGYTLALPAGTQLSVARNSFQFDAP